MAEESVKLVQRTAAGGTSASFKDLLVKTDWSLVGSKPLTFPPDGHQHAASDITSGTLAVARGGTGLVTSTGRGYLLVGDPDGAWTVLAPTTGKYLYAGSGGNLSWQDPPGGGVSVSGNNTWTGTNTFQGTTGLYTTNTNLDMKLDRRLSGNGENFITFASTSSAVTKTSAYSGAVGYIRDATDINGALVLWAGGSERFRIKNNGTVDVKNNKITNLATPTANTDAATKKYVDDNIGGGVSVSGNNTWTGANRFNNIQLGHQGLPVWNGDKDDWDTFIFPSVYAGVLATQNWVLANAAGGSLDWTLEGIYSHTGGGGNKTIDMTGKSEIFIAYSNAQGAMNSMSEVLYGPKHVFELGLTLPGFSSSYICYYAGPNVLEISWDTIPSAGFKSYINVYTR